MNFISELALFLRILQMQADPVGWHASPHLVPELPFLRVLPCVDVDVGVADPNRKVARNRSHIAQPLTSPCVGRYARGRSYAENCPTRMLDEQERSSSSRGDLCVFGRMLEANSWAELLQCSCIRLHHISWVLKQRGILLASHFFVSAWYLSFRLLLIDSWLYVDLCSNGTLSTCPEESL